jgi:hypothetical protein
MTKTITSGQTLTARSACDYDCIFQIEVLARTPKTATVRYQGKVSRCKIYTNNEGHEYVRALGTYSLAPSFYAN